VTRELVVTDDLVGEAVRRFLEAAPRTVALAGGSTPRPVYGALAGAPVDWASIEVFFGDERCVPPDHPDSNHRMAAEALLARVPARVHRMPGESCDPDAYEAELRGRFGQEVPRLDLCFLGLGEDGHTASLFPGDPVLEVADRWVARVDRPDHPRLTLTLPVLSASRIVLFLVSGAAKREALGRLMAGEDVPAARVDAERTVVVATPDAAS
jgi:6-phosphogluconolactonase